ncbi:MAG: sulfotransferase, partial [Bacillota bacterium]
MKIFKGEDIINNSGPILITGTFRSGTTLISQIMRNHPNIALVYDSVNFMRFS